MTAKEFVRTLYPLAHAERFKYNGPGNRTYYLVWNRRLGQDRIRLSEGKTKSEAWSNARKHLEKTIKNPG